MGYVKRVLNECYPDLHGRGHVKKTPHEAGFSLTQNQKETAFHFCV